MPVCLTRQRSNRIVSAVISWLAAGLLLAACAPAPTVLPPTAEPAPATAVPATDLPATAAPTLAPTLAPPTATAVPATADPGPDMLAQVAAFEAAYDQHDIDGVMALMVEDPKLSLLFGTFTGYEAAVSTLAVRNRLEFQSEFNTELDATDCTAKNDTVTCVVLMKDDCTPTTVDAYHFRTQFKFTEGQLASIYGTWDSADERAFIAFDVDRVAWAKVNLPEDAVTYAIYPGEFIEDFGEWSKVIGTGEQGTGKLTPAEFGQLVERICTGYAAASQ